MAPDTCESSSRKGGGRGWGLPPVLMSLTAGGAPEGNVLRRALADWFRPLEPEVHLSTTRPYLGDTVAVSVTVSDPRTPFGHLHRALVEAVGGGVVKAKAGGKPVKMYKKSQSTYRGFLPTTPLSTAGPVKIEVDVRDGRHRAVEVSGVEVLARKFPVQEIWLEGEKEGLTGTDEEFDKVDVLTSTSTHDQLWAGTFAKPTAGVVTTEYGVRRYYNGVFRDNYFHRGVDYGCDEGTPVEAAEEGRVVLVGREEEGFHIHGNCVGLDHGHGVTSIYMHLHDVEVAEGDVVGRGERVGTVGNTGASTGPHLHWGLYVAGECVDPYQWLDEHLSSDFK